MDTIVLRLHNINKHFFLVNQIVALTAGYTINLNSLEINTPVKTLLKKLKENASTGVFIEEGEIDEIINHKHDSLNSVSGFLNMKTVLMHDSDKKLNIAYRKKHKAKSSSYDLLTNVCYDRDYIEWNFSVPKFLYGHNIAQFVSHQGEHNFTHPRDSWNDVKSDMYERFRYFVNSFFKKNFVLDSKNFKIDFMDLELNRIDFSWNCFFRTESEAKVYLDYIKKLKPKGIRENSDVRGGLYGGTYMIVRDGYSTKVYHKGTEFKVSDKKQLLKNKDFSNEQIEKLQQMADKILRFEITLRNQHMSYLYQTRLWRKNSVRMNEIKEEAKEGRKYYELKTKDSEKYNILIKPNNLYKNHVKIGISNHGKKMVEEKIQSYKTIEACNTVRRRFVFGSSDSVDFYNENYSPILYVERGGKKVIELDKEVCLSKPIFNLWLSAFEDFVKESEVRFLPSFDSLQNKIVKHNNKVQNVRDLVKVPESPKLVDEIWSTTFTKQTLEKMGAGKKLNAKRVIRHLALLQKYTVKEILDYWLVERTTLWRLKKDLEKFGMDLKLGMRPDEERISIVPDYLFEWKEFNDELQSEVLIRHSQGFHVYNMYIINEKSWSNPTYC